MGVLGIMCNVKYMANKQPIFDAFTVLTWNMRSACFHPSVCPCIACQ